MKSTRKFIREFIQTCQDNRNNQYAAILKRDYFNLYQQILDDYSATVPSQSLYNFVNNITTPPTCFECESLVKFINYSKGYHQFCTSACKNTSIALKEKRKQTNIKKYGSSSVLTSDYGRQQTQQTIQKKYGVDHYSKTEEFKQKFTSTMKDRYGVEYAMQSVKLRERYQDSLESNHGVRHPSQSPEIYKTRNETMKERYGVNHAMQSKELTERHRQTLQANYGVDYPLQNKEIHDKFKQTMVERYGKEFTAQVDWLFDQMKQTNLDKYDVEFPMQNEEIFETYKKTCLDKYGVEFPSQNEDIKKQKRLKMEAEGKWIPLELISNANCYYRQVTKYTNSQSLSTLNHFKQRGLAGVDGAYHVDHKVSIKYGFVHSIPPYIIGNIHNLEMLTWRDNIYKSCNCSIDIEDLINLIIPI